MSDDPIRAQMALLLQRPVNRPGTVLLYRDRITHVASPGAMAAMLAGIWMGAAGRLVRRKAAEKAAGGRAVTTIRLADVTEVRKASHGPNWNLLEVVGAGDSVLTFGLKYDDWKPDLIAALTAAGRQVNDGGDAVTVS
jgi:hypothetical protein